MRRFNLDQAKFVYEDDPEGFRSGYDRFGEAIGAERIGGTVYELPRGQSICPYHYEYGDEEWLIVLAGAPTVRHPDGEDMLAVGDVVCFPAGPAGAHTVTNNDANEARVLMISTKRMPAVAIYPDSGKIGIFTGDDEDSGYVRRESRVDYWDGEA